MSQAIFVHLNSIRRRLCHISEMSSIQMCKFSVKNMVLVTGHFKTHGHTDEHRMHIYDGNLQHAHTRKRLQTKQRPLLIIENAFECCVHSR
jgi:hypothetical protein